MTELGAGGGAHESGVALVSAVLFALIVVLAGQGILVFAGTQRWIASADGARWMAEEERRAALVSVLASLDTLPAPGPLVAHGVPITVVSLGPELRLLVADPGGRSPGRGWAGMVAAPQPLPRVASRSGAARVGGAVFESDPSSPPPDVACPTGLEGLPAARTGPLLDPLSGPALGVLDLHDLLAALPELVEARLELPEDGPEGCEDVGGFGDPARPGPCPGVWGEGGRAGDLVLSGRGQGVLAVSGDLTLAAGAEFRGWVWVGGTLSIGPGAELRGLVDAGDRFVVEPTGAFLPDGCSGALALAAIPRLLRPVPVGPDAWPVERP